MTKRDGGHPWSRLALFTAAIGCAVIGGILGEELGGWLWDERGKFAYAGVLSKYSAIGESEWVGITAP